MWDSRNLSILVSLASLLIILRPSQVTASPYYCSPSTYPTVIESIEPQAAVAGVTKVYVLGQCFGDNPGALTVNGTPVTDFSLWSDGEIVITVPFTATSGNLVVTSSNYGSDSSANEADCANAGWCGTASINADFYVNAPNAPPFYISPTEILIPGTPSPSEYITDGGWHVDSSGAWGPDIVGIWSQGVDWYQQHEPAGCTIVVPQAMNINTMDELLTQYTTNQLIIKISPNEVCTEVMTMDSQTVKQGLAYPPPPGTPEETCFNDGE